MRDARPLASTCHARLDQSRCLPMPPTFSDLQAPVAPVELARAPRAPVTPAARHTHEQILTPAGKTHLRTDPEVLGADGRLDGREHCRQRRARQGHGVVARPCRGRIGRAVHLDSQPHAQRRRHGHQPERRASDCRGRRVGRNTAGRADCRGPAANIDVSWRPGRRLARGVLPSGFDVDVWQQRLCGSCGPAVLAVFFRQSATVKQP